MRQSSSGARILIGIATVTQFFYGASLGRAKWGGMG
jgi:hypothetical protein